MSDLDDDATTISRPPAVDDDATTISRAPVVDDDATTIIRASAVDDDETTITRAALPDEDATTISRGGALDDRTVVSSGRIEAFDDATQIRGAARPGVDEDTAISGDRQRQQRGPRASAPAPGRLSGGRVAFVPGEKVERYQVRERTPVTDSVVRHVIPAPTSAARQSRSTVAIETAVSRQAASRGIGVIIAIAVVTVLAVAIVGGVVAVLFLF